MSNPGEIQHDICDGCAQGALEAQICDRNNQLREQLNDGLARDTQRTIDNINRRAAENTSRYPSDPRIAAAFEENRLAGVRSVEANASVGGMQRVVCGRNGPGRWGKCGARPTDA